MGCLAASASLRSNNNGGTQLRSCAYMDHGTRTKSSRLRASVTGRIVIAPRVAPFMAIYSPLVALGNAERAW